MTVARNTTPGPGETTGNAQTDPTRNVLDLVDAAIRRQDDLRLADSLRISEAINDLRRSADDRAKHDNELRTAEAARIDAIRATDVQAVQRAAEVQATQATTLAATVATSAETLRTQVAASASAAAVALDAALEPVKRDIADLRKSQYESAGSKAQVVETRSNVTQYSGLLFGIVGFVQTIIIVAISIYAATH